jgi:hypothetical protein
MAQTNVQVFSGNVGIGTTSPSYKLDNNHNSTRLAGVINYTKTASSVNSDTYVYIGRFTTTGVNTVNIYCSGNSSFSGNYATFIRHYDQIPTVPYLLQGDLYTTHKFYYQIVDVTSYDVWHRQTTLPGLTCTYYISGPSVDLPSEPAVTNRLEFPYGHIAKQGFSSGITTNSFNSRVGIGITSPGGLLDIRAVASDPSIPTVHIGDNAADYGDYGMVNLVRLATESGSKAHLAFIRSGNTVFCQGFYNDTNTFGFWPSFGSVTNTPAMSFATNGRVGLGTTSPSSKLHIYDSSSSVIHVGTDTGQAQLLLTSGASVRRASRIDFARADNGTQYASIIGDYQQSGLFDLTFVNNTAGRTMTILQSGNVGIGTTVPVTKFHAIGGSMWLGGVVNEGYYADTRALKVKKYAYGINTNTLAVSFELGDVYRAGIAKVYFASGVSGQTVVPTTMYGVWGFSYTNNNFAATTMQYYETHAGNGITFTVTNGNTLTVRGTMYSSFSYPAMEVELYYAGGIYANQ